MYRISCLYTTKRIRRSDCFAIGTVYWQFWHVCNKVFYKIVGKTRVWLHENPITESGKIVHKPRKQNLLYLGDLHMSPGTTDIRWGNCLYCIAENPLPLPNFSVRPKHILSATSAQIFRFLLISAFIGCP